MNHAIGVLWSGLLVVLIGGLLPSECNAQLEVCIEWNNPGVWSGVYDFETTMDPNEEIAHGFVLPPPAMTPNLQRVLLICRQSCAEYTTSAWQSFIWYPQEPSTVDVVMLPDPDGAGPIGPGNAEPFCCGVGFAPDGSALTFGGLNYVEKCTNPAPCIQVGSGPDTNTPVGHKVVYRLDTSQDPPVWTDDATWPALLQMEHWYPTGLSLHNGTNLVTGHFGAPSLHPACLWPYGPGVQSIDRRFELFNPLTGVATIADNLVEPCNGSELFSTDNYPRLHLLSTGKVVHTNAKDAASLPTTRYLDVAQPACPPALRWEVPLPSTSQPPLMRHGGSSVHLVKLDPAVAGGLRDIVYTFGGLEGSDDEPCPFAASISDSVQRLTDPDTDAVGYKDWKNASWVDAAPMPQRRVNHNAVILATGEILIVGGEDENCDSVLGAVGFRPPEIFGGPAGGAWKNRASQAMWRRYHSVAGLLPDGRVYSAGGNADYLSYHSIEVFSPGYYLSGDRPRVGTVPAFALYGDVLLQVPVALKCFAPNHVSRVVLIRNSASTHAFDSNQRYIELPFVENGAYPNVTVDITIHTNRSAVPPGYYLLFVLDSNGIPSTGKWIRIQEP